MMARDKTYRPWSPRQSFLLPPSPMEWLPEGHLAYFILDVVEQLDLSEIERAIQAKDPRGNRPYSPAMMAALLIYAYCTGVFSSRKIERAISEDVAFRVLAGGEQPHFTTLNEFRKHHQDSFAGLFRQVLALCQKAGLVKLGQVAIDGTKIQGNASRHKAMSYERMKKRQAELEAEVERLLARAKQVNQEEDARYGEGQREEDLPEELRRREKRLATIVRARAELEAEAREARAAQLREQAARARKKADSAPTDKERKQAERRAEARERAASNLEPASKTPASFVTPEGLPKHRPRTQRDGTPHPKAQRNFTDPDSRIMESGGTFLQGYNCQLAVDAQHQIIVAQGVTNQPPDAGNLPPMLEQVRSHCAGQAPEIATADAGYWSPEVPQECLEKAGTKVLISLRRQRHGESPPKVSTGPPPEEASPREKMAWKLQTEPGRAAYARRKAIVEPVNGQIKEARGYRRFLLRGLNQVRNEWSLVCLGHNLLKLHRSAGLVAG